MCGILGTINQPFDRNILDLIAHRGPDDSGLNTFHIAGNTITFGHRRLSIVDLSVAGHQPMVTDCGNYAIIFNGEIYNHTELREKLKNKSILFKGHSDTETILYYFKFFGMEAVRDLNGIFAFSFLDIKKQQLFLVRDPFGIKPLYYSVLDNKLVFSSEIKIFRHFMTDFSLNTYHLYTFLRIRFSPSPQTLIDGINKMEPGHYIQFDIPTMKYKNFFYSYHPVKNSKITEQEAIDKYDELLHHAVKRQLMSDVPIAILLSGGVDSALLTRVAQKVSGEHFHTFSVGYNFLSNANELEAARQSARLLGTNHHEIVLGKDDFSDNLKQFIKMVEEPIGSQSIFPFYYLTKRIHDDGFKVALSGQGVDESWAGYKRYNVQQLFHYFAHPAFGYLKFSRRFIRNDKYRRALNAIGEKNKILRFIETYSFFDSKMTARLTNSCFNKEHHQKLIDFFEKKFEILHLKNYNMTDSLMFLDARMNLSDDLLLYTDKLSMQHSLELRVPFLDVELMRFAESLPYNFKVNLFENKRLYKKLAERHLPKEIIYRKKKGFFIPRKEWFKSEVGKAFETTIMNDKGVFSQLFNKSYIQQLFAAHRQGKNNFEDQLYSLLNLFFWVKTNLN